MKYIWQLPQTILALIMIVAWKGKYEKSYKGVRIYRTKVRNGISLGNIIILGDCYDLRTIKHEYGHSIQSLYLGWAYLLIVGIPSITFNIISRVNKKFSSNYYKRFPEDWADRLGKVNRS